MASISTYKIAGLLKERGIKVVTLSALSKILNLENKNTIYKIMERMEKYKLIKKLIKGKYALADTNMSDFEKANIVVVPSYISLESALSFYGILPQFTYSINSISTLKSRSYKIDKKMYKYSKIQNKLYNGFTKKDGFLIASPEKALIDLIYLASKDLRKVDISELDLNDINWKEFNNLKKSIANKPFQNYIKNNNLYAKQ